MSKLKIMPNNELWDNLTYCWEKGNNAFDIFFFKIIGFCLILGIVFLAIIKINYWLIPIAIIVLETFLVAKHKNK